MQAMMSQQQHMNQAFISETETQAAFTPTRFYL